MTKSLSDVIKPLSKHEIEIMEAVNGERSWPKWGAWVGACMSFLREDGLVTAEEPAFASLTRRGADMLREARKNEKEEKESN